MTVCQEASSLGLRIRLNRSFIIPSSGLQDYSAICIVICVVCTSPCPPLGTTSTTEYLLLHYGASSFHVRISRDGTWKAHLTRPRWIPISFPLNHAASPPFIASQIPLFSGPFSRPSVSPFQLLEGLGRFLFSWVSTWIWWQQARTKWCYSRR